MKKKLWFWAILVMVLVFGMTFGGYDKYPKNDNSDNAATGFSQTSSNVRWEYYLLNAGRGIDNNNEVLRMANELGNEGWELVTGFSGNYVGGLIFKRRLP